MKVVCFDLDDTLSKEIEYLKSAYKKIVSIAVGYSNKSNIPESILCEESFNVMINAYNNGCNAFTQLNLFLNIDLPINFYLDIYRNHIPNINLSEEIETLLKKLREKRYILGLITDGRSIQQRHKIEALGLGCFISDDDIIISEEFGSEKPSESNYNYFMKRHSYADQYIYIGDNPQKDFITPNKLGWLTIGILDNGNNIHKQQLDLPKEYLPKIWVKNVADLSLFIN